MTLDASFVSLVDNVDDTPPVISRCPDTATITVPVGQIQTLYFWPEPSAVDDSGIPPTLVQSHFSTSMFPVGSTDVTYTFTDNSGNSAVCTFMINGTCPGCT